MSVIKLDGSVPVKYGVRINNDEKYGALKTELSNLCGIPSHLIKLAEVQNALIKVTNRIYLFWSLSLFEMRNVFFFSFT